MSPNIPKGHGKTHIGTVYLGGVFDDGGGIEISPTKDGGIVVIHIPPSSPVFEGLSAEEVTAGKALSADLLGHLQGYVAGGAAANG